MALPYRQVFITPPQTISSDHLKHPGTDDSSIAQPAPVASIDAPFGNLTPQSSVSGEPHLGLANMLPQAFSSSDHPYQHTGPRPSLRPEEYQGFQGYDAASRISSRGGYAFQPTFDQHFQMQHAVAPGTATILDWNQMQYTPGDYTTPLAHDPGIVPHQPTGAARRRSRVESRATSTNRSYGSQICNFAGCGRSFKNKADLE